jgi:hypothetical protein
MRLIWLLPLALPALLSACGGHEASVSLTVRCDGSIALVGTKSVDVLNDSVTGNTTLSFPDPVNPDHTGIIPVARGSRCSVGLTKQT